MSKSQEIARVVGSCLNLSGGGIKIDVSNFFGQMHAEDYLDWEVSLETYLKWNPMVEDREVLFAKLRLKGHPLGFKKVEEQRTRHGKINTWAQMKLKLRKQFLPADYPMELYKRFLP